MAGRCRAIRAAGSPSRQSRRPSTARPRSRLIPSGSRSSSPVISRCRRAVSISVGPTSPSSRNIGSTNTSFMLLSPSPAQIGSIGSSSTARGHDLASSRPANRISTCVKRSTISGSTMPMQPRLECAFTRWRCPGRWSARASAISPRGSKRSSWWKKSAQSSRTSSKSNCITGAKMCVRASSGNSTKTATGSCRRTAS